MPRMLEAWYYTTSPLNRGMYPVKAYDDYHMMETDRASMLLITDLHAVAADEKLERLRALMRKTAYTTILDGLPAPAIAEDDSLTLYESQLNAFRAQAGLVHEAHGNAPTLLNVEARMFLEDAGGGAVAGAQSIREKVLDMAGTTMDLHIKQYLGLAPAAAPAGIPSHDPNVNPDAEAQIAHLFRERSHDAPDEDYAAPADTEPLYAAPAVPAPNGNNLLPAAAHGDALTTPTETQAKPPTKKRKRITASSVSMSKPKLVAWAETTTTSSSSHKPVKRAKSLLATYNDLDAMEEDAVAAASSDDDPE